MTKDRKLFKAASYLILEKDNKIYLMRRANTGYMDGRYGLPAGHIEEGETAVDCIIREAKEEVGIDIHDPKFVCVIQTTEGYFTLFFAVNNWEGELKVCEPEKCDDAKWVDKDDLSLSMPPEVESALRNYKEGKYYSNT